MIDVNNKMIEDFDLLTISYHKKLNTIVLYRGTNEKLLRFFSVLDINNTDGEFTPDRLVKDTKSGLYKFELGKEFMQYAKSDDFKSAMYRCNCHVTVED